MSDLPPETGDPPDAGIDFTGIGKAMQAIPKSAWGQLVDTACRSFEKTLSPITESAHGLGRLIKGKFDRMIDVEQVMAAESVESARRKAAQTGRNFANPASADTVAGHREFGEGG